MTRTTALMDDSLEAIRQRAAESVTWPGGELAVALGVATPDIPTDVADALWRAVQDRAILVVLVDAMLRDGVLPEVVDLDPVQPSRPTANATDRPSLVERLIGWLLP